jgi:hypothetical protein
MQARIASCCWLSGLARLSCKLRWDGIEWLTALSVSRQRRCDLGISQDHLYCCDLASLLVLSHEHLTGRWVLSDQDRGAREFGVVDSCRRSPLNRNLFVELDEFQDFCVATGVEKELDEISDVRGDPEGTY